MPAKPYTTVGMVAFVDLLGFAARVRGIEKAAHLKVIERDVRNVQTWFDHKTKDSTVREVQKLQAKTVLAFSDCLVIAVPSYSTLAGHEGDFDVLLGEIVAMAFAQGRCALNGIFVRGGADYGLWHKRKDTIVSPAMVVAYDLERCHAQVPMIAMSDDLMRHFTEHEHRKFYHKSDDPVRRYFREFELPNGKKQWMIDYFPLFLGEVDGNLTPKEKELYQRDRASRAELRATAWQRGIKETALAHKEAILVARAAAGSRKVKAKYDWLAKYHNDALSRFLRRPPPELLIDQR